MRKFFLFVALLGLMCSSLFAEDVNLCDDSNTKIGTATFSDPTEKSYQPGEVINVSGTWSIDLAPETVTIQLMSFNTTYGNATAVDATDIVYDSEAKTFSGTITIPEDFPLKQSSGENSIQLIQVRLDITNYANMMGIEVTDGTAPVIETVVANGVTGTVEDKYFNITTEVKQGDNITVTGTITPNTDVTLSFYVSYELSGTPVNATSDNEGNLNTSIQVPLDFDITAGKFQVIQVMIGTKWANYYLKNLKAADTESGNTEGTGTASDAILDVTFDNDYFTAQGWAANNKIYNPTSTSTPTLADGFSAIIAGKNDTYAPIMILGSGAGTGKDALCLMLSNIMGGDSWFTYSATELEVDAEYKLTTTIGSNNGTLLPSVGLLAWETGTVPQEKYIQTNALIDELNKNIAIENEITETFTATSTSMTFGIGFGPSVNSTDARYIYNMRVLIGNMKIEKVEDDDVTTDIESTEATTISLYPNPATNKLNVAGLAEGESVEIYNATGALVISTMNTSIDVSNLAQGIYFVKLGNVVKQFVKQ